MPAVPALAGKRGPPLAQHMRGRALASAFVAVVYVLLTLSAPWLVRYGAEVAPTVVAVTQAAADPAAPRCATAPEHGRACPDDDAFLD